MISIFGRDHLAHRFAERKGTGMPQELNIPTNYEAEEGIIACLLCNWRQIASIVDRLSPAHFHDDKLATIYGCILDLYQRGQPPTIPRVADEWARRIVQPLEVRQLSWELERYTMSLATLHGVDAYVDSVIRVSQHRRLIQACQRIVEAAYHQADNSLQLAEEAILAIALDGDLKGLTPFGTALDAYLAQYEQRRVEASEGKSVGVKTGLRAVDALLGGLRPGTLNILAARTSVGKTSLALTIALAIAKNALTGGGEVAFFSLEMQQDELVQRLLAMDVPIDQSLLRDGRTNEAEHRQVRERAELLRPIGLHIADNIYQLDALKSNARILCTRRKIALIVVDYLQLVDVVPDAHQKYRARVRYEEVGEISKGLKRLAQELQVPVLALAQLNRVSEEVEEPQLRHLGESGRLENDADLVAFLHCRKEEVEKRNQAQPYQMDFWVRKHRNGRIGKVTLGFRPHLTRFDDLSHDQEHPR